MLNDTSVKALPVAVDVMGGDLGPEVVIVGAIKASESLQIPVVLVGDQNIINDVLKRNDALKSSLVSVYHAEDAYTMNDVPSRAIRARPKASMRICYDLVKEGKASSVVSTGNTGLMMAVGLFVSGVLPGIARPAIATIIPKASSDMPTVLVDSGANVDCNAEQLVQFALMGGIYARKAISCINPRVGLLSNGTESSKGSDITRAASAILADLDDINYIGYVEGRDIPRDVVDVVACDGFVGNVVLKAMEGSVELVLDSLKTLANQNFKAKLGMWLAKPTFKKLFHEKLDPSSYGGAPLLGLNHIAIVCHGASNQKAILNAIRIARKLEEGKIIEHMEKALSSLDIGGTGDYENGMWKRLGHKFDKNKTKKVKAEQETSEKQLDLEQEKKEENS